MSTYRVIDTTYSTYGTFIVFWHKNTVNIKLNINKIGIKVNEHDSELRLEDIKSKI